MNSIRLNLQTRISVSLTAFALIVACIIGGVEYSVNEKIERQIWEHTLEAELQFHLDRKNLNGFWEETFDSEFQLNREGKNYHNSYLSPQKYSLKIYERHLGHKSGDQIPPELDHLSVGLHDEFQFEDKQFSVLVKEIDNYKYLVVYDITKIEEEEKLFITTSTITILVLCAFIHLISTQISRWLLKPINMLAEEVSNLDPTKNNLKIADSYDDQEVKVIALAIDKFLMRLKDFIFRENEFLTTASHELRTPIAIIRGACDVLELNQDLSIEVRKPLSRISNSAKEMGNIVSALMYLAKEAQFNEIKEVCNLNYIIKKSVEDNRYLLKDKKITISKELDDSEIVSDDLMVSIVISNLIRNSFQHTQNGTILISLRDNEFKITDTGPGMPHTLISTLERSIDTTRKEANGFGLYIIRKICERLNWKIEFSSSTDGTTAILNFSST